MPTHFIACSSALCSLRLPQRPPCSLISSGGQRGQPAGWQRAATRRPRRPLAAAEADAPPPPPQQLLQPPLEAQASDSQLWSEVQLLAVRAQSLEASGGAEQAAAMLGAALERLERRHGPASLQLVALRQLLWDLLHTGARHDEALQQARRVHEAVAAQFGAASAEIQLVAVRLGISTAACGQLEEGIRLIYDATPVLQHNLGLMLRQAQQLAGQRQPGGGAADDGQEEAAELAALQENIDKVATALGEGNFYGSLLTLQHAAQRGMQEGVVRGWEELEQIVDSGFGSLVAAAAYVDGGDGLVANALREHDRVTQQLSGDVLLARLVQRQNERLHEVGEQGMEHPLFQG